ncbi:MAG: hypothetical protein JW719_00845 [Pirellulales bacterium]|nr:hypothetical protein [Pirellulales bacterium]
MVKMIACSFCLLAGLLVSDSLGLDITVSPHVLVVKAPGEVVTVHTDIAYGAVGDCMLNVNGSGLAVTTFADNCGNLVVQCSRADVVAVLGDGATTADFTLTVDTVAGSFSASDSVAVKR